MIISEGVRVYHGMLNKNCDKYLMFVGEDSQIKEVKYGEHIIFPLGPLEDEFRYKLYVEYLGRYNVKVIRIHFIKVFIDNHEEYSEILYRITSEIPVKMKKIQERILNSDIFLSVDISDSSKVHPFIKVTKNETDESTSIEYTLVEEFVGTRLDAENNPNYKLGNIFDSTVPVFALYSKYTLLGNSCKSVVVEYSQHSIDIYITGYDTVFHYQKKFKYLSLGWFYEGDASLLYETSKKNAVTLFNKLHEQNSVGIGEILDIDEAVSPDFFNVEKVSGNLGQMKYKKYNKRFGDNNIKYIIESKLKNVKIYTSQTDEEIICVQVIEIDGTKYIIILYKIHYLFSFDRETSIYKESPCTDRKTIKIKYKRLTATEKNEKLEYFMKNGPVYLSIDIDSSSTKTYESIKLNDDIFNFNYYFINQFDKHDEGVNLNYSFGSIYEVKPYLHGNIPTEKHKMDTRIIKTDINSTEFLIMNPLKHKPLEVSSYEIYTIIL